MKQRGRQSAAALSVVMPGGIEAVTRANAPDTLTEEQGMLWREIISTKPADWFGPETYPLLQAYCKAVSDYQRISALVDSFDLSCLADDDDMKRFDKLTVIQDRLAKSMAMLATKMRLAQQSKYCDKTAGRADRTHKKRPWESE